MERAIVRLKWFHNVLKRVTVIGHIKSGAEKFAQYRGEIIF